jgi:Family of unknown function (DUF6113)
VSEHSLADAPALDAEPPLQPRADAFVGGAAYGALAVAGALLGVLGSFLQGGGIGPVPVAAIVFSLLNLVAFRLSGWAMGAKLGAIVPSVAWLLVVIFLSSKRPEGDLVINSSVASYVFLIGGSIGAVIAVARTKSARDWLLTDPLSGQPRLDRLG